MRTCWLAREVAASEFLIVLGAVWFWVLSLCPVTSQEGANTTVLTPLHLPWLRGRSKRCCSASQRQGMPCSPGPEHARKEKETRHLVPVLLCRWTLSCLELALYELAANLNRLFRLFCNHRGSTGTSSGCYPSIENYLKQMGWISLGRWPSPSVDDKGPRLLVYSRCLTFSWWIQIRHTLLLCV